MRFYRAAIFIVALVFGSCPDATAADPAQRPLESPRANSIILLIGDGMGPGEFTLALYHRHLVQGGTLNMERVTEAGHLGLITTMPLQAIVTDSAAAATALATGQSVPNGSISVDPEGGKLKTILEYAHENGMSTGLVTTTKITHATPAAFAVHVGSRSTEGLIAQRYVEAEIDVLMGGGITYWIPRGTVAGDFAAISDAAGSQHRSARKDSRNLIADMKDRGYHFLSNEAELQDAPERGRLLGLFGASHLPWALDREPEDATGVPSLSLMVRKAMAVLSKNPKGFFLMAEGGRMDHASHINDAGSCLAETLEFDEAVGTAVEYVRTHPDTLLLVTADHSTGGMSIAYRYSEKLRNNDYHSTDNLRTIGAQRASFQRILEDFSAEPTLPNLRRTVAKYNPAIDPAQISQKDFQSIMHPEALGPFHMFFPTQRPTRYPAVALGRVLSEEYGVTWSTGNHTFLPVMVMAWGPRSEDVVGIHNNTFIFEVMRTALGLQPER